MANVTIIPPREKMPDTLRVAAYCRVSSDSSDHIHSYASQIRKYTTKISEHDGWELVDIYADEAVTGTRMDKREDFNRLLSDCRKGKINKILVKSISRFARNTKDCLVALRELAALGVTVCFEKENISTETLTSELMVSVFGSLAQEESVSTSKNQRINYQRRMERGEFITCKAPFGYRMPDGKNLTIYEPEADIIRKIFALYLEGRSAQEIADIISKTGISTRDGNLHWNTTTICYILTNEKYIGDVLCQKTLATESFPYVKKRNEGEKGQYYVDMTHLAIISRDTFERARRLLNCRAPHKALDRKEYPLRRKMICQQSGSTCVRKELASGSISWCCYKHTKSAQACPVGRIPESEIYAAFVRMYNKLRLHEGIILTPALAQRSSSTATPSRRHTIPSTSRRIRTGRWPGFLRMKGCQARA